MRKKELQIDKPDKVVMYQLHFYSAYPLFIKDLLPKHHNCCASRRRRKKMLSLAVGSSVAAMNKVSRHHTMNYGNGSGKSTATQFGFIKGSQPPPSLLSTTTNISSSFKTAVAAVDSNDLISSPTPPDKVLPFLSLSLVYLCFLHY